MDTFVSKFKTETHTLTLRNYIYISMMNKKMSQSESFVPTTIEWKNSDSFIVIMEMINNRIQDIYNRRGYKNHFF